MIKIDLNIDKLIIMSSEGSMQGNARNHHINIFLKIYLQNFLNSK